MYPVPCLHSTLIQEVHFNCITFSCGYGIHVGITKGKQKNDFNQNQSLNIAVSLGFNLNNSSWYKQTNKTKTDKQTEKTKRY